MSSASLLGQNWSYNADLNKVSIEITGLEKQSKPGRLRSTLTVCNGPTGLQVKLVAYF